jgi:hypothetical protein
MLLLAGLVCRGDVVGRGTDARCLGRFSRLGLDTVSKQPATGVAANDRPIGQE